MKAPRDPERDRRRRRAVDEVEPPEGPGLDQGAVRALEEPLTRDDADAGRRCRRRERRRRADARPSGRCSAPPPTVPSRTYVGVGISDARAQGPAVDARGRAARAAAAAAAGADVAYDETAITRDLAAGRARRPPATADDVLPSTPIGVARPAIAYNVYDATDRTRRKLTRRRSTSRRSSTRGSRGARSAATPSRTVETSTASTIESDASPSDVRDAGRHVSARRRRQGCTAVASEGAINLIWEPNTEKDLAGYIVLRGVAPAETLSADDAGADRRDRRSRTTCRPGIAYVYAVQAVDKAGNVEPDRRRASRKRRVEASAVS